MKWFALLLALALGGCAGITKQNVICSALDCAMAVRHGMCPKHDPYSCPFGHPEDTLDEEPPPDEASSSSLE